MEQKPHVPGYGKDEKLNEYMKREMTIEEIDAMEVEPMIVMEQKGIIKSKTEALKKPDIAGTQHRIKTEEMSLYLLQEKLARELFSGKSSQATEVQIEHKKREIEKMKSGIMHHGKAGKA